MQMPNVISKRKMPSSKGVFIDESHKKENMRLYIMNSYYAQNLSGHSTQSAQLIQKCHLLRLITSSYMNLKDEWRITQDKAAIDGDIQLFCKILHQDKPRLNKQSIQSINQYPLHSHHRRVFRNFLFQFFVIF